MAAVRIGTAGWTIPRIHASAIQGKGSHLERYSARFSCTEINSTFYRPSRESTWLRWAASVPEDFRFAVKAPKAVTHEAGLELTEESTATLRGFLEQVRLLGAKLGPLLFQLPPKQPFDPDRAHIFFAHLRTLYGGAAVIEPRHPTWFSSKAESLLSRYSISRVAADPAPVPEAFVPGACTATTYYRLHGSPRKYYSDYTHQWLKNLAAEVQSRPAGTDTWVIFDNTASGAAAGNALMLLDILAG